MGKKSPRGSRFFHTGKSKSATCMTTSVPLPAPTECMSFFKFQNTAGHFPFSVGCRIRAVQRVHII